MNIQQLHGWDMSIREAMALQKELAGRVSFDDVPGEVQFVAGVDMAVKRGRGEGAAAVVVLSYPELELVESRRVCGEVTFPYVPGLLTFREAPLALRAFEQLNNTPDLVIVDGQGVAHPRRMGIAAHLGLFLEVPTIGCAKSRLIGEHDEPAQAAGSHTPLTDEGDVIGEVVRTQAGTRPLYVSVGHRISLGRAVQMVMACCKGYRLPEPSRLAHQAAGGTLRRVPFSFERRRSGRGCSQWTVTLPRLYGECAQPGTGREVGR